MSDDFQYNADSIQVLQGLEPVRKRPGMYFGDMEDGSGLHHWVFEVVDNAIAEAEAGYGDRVTVTVHSDREITIEDRGRGIPVEHHCADGRSVLEVVWTTLHAGGVFDPGSYKIGAGLCGVGVAAVNALSERLCVDVFRDGGHWRARYERGEPVGALERVGPSSNTGTRVRMSADLEIFPAPVHDFDVIARRLERMAWMCAGVTLELLDHRTDRHASFHCPGGMVEMLTGRARDEDVLHVHVTRAHAHVEFALQPSFYPSPARTFVNGHETPEHGSHLQGMSRAFHRALCEDARPWHTAFALHGWGGAQLLQRSFDVVLHVRVPHPRYHGSTKRRFHDKGAAEVVDEVAYPVFVRWLQEHGEEADALLTRWTQEP